jgi:hypothetical protein
MLTSTNKWDFSQRFLCFFISLHLLIDWLLIVWVYRHIQTHACTSALPHLCGQRTICQTLFSPFMCSPGIETRSLGFETSALLKKAYLFILHYVPVCRYVCNVSVGILRAQGWWLPRVGVTGVWQLPDMGTEKRTQVLCKCTVCSEPLSWLFSPLLS